MNAPSVAEPVVRTRFYYGWIVLLIAALAMVGTLPGRTQGLGLITEPLLRDFKLSRVDYAQINLWATLIGSVLCIGIGRLQDSAGSRPVLTVISLLLGTVVVAMSATRGVTSLFVLIALTRGLGQSALSVVSLTMVGQWFRRRLEGAMAIYTVVMSMGFMIAFPVVGSLVTSLGWRTAWSGIGWALVLVLAPLAVFLVKRSPESMGLMIDGRPAESDSPTEPEAVTEGATLIQALATPAFWVMSIGSALYGLIASGIGLFNESVLKERGFEAGLYHNTLALTALTALIGNFLGGYLAAKGSMSRLMSAAMLLLGAGLAALPNVSQTWQVMLIAVAMGIAGGFVMVLFFSFWGKIYGRTNLGQIQGAAQMMTVLASAAGPLLLAECVTRTGSYAAAFYLLTVLVGLVALAAWLVAIPTGFVTRNRSSHDETVSKPGGAT